MPGRTTAAAWCCATNPTAASGDLSTRWGTRRSRAAITTSIPRGEGLAAFRLEQFGNYGYVDVKGNVAISPRFSVARPFSGGVAVVSYNNVNFGLVDRNGGEVSSFRYKRIGRFNDGWRLSIPTSTA